MLVEDISELETFVRDANFTVHESNDSYELPSYETTFALIQLKYLRYAAISRHSPLFLVIDVQLRDTFY